MAKETKAKSKAKTKTVVVVTFQRDDEGWWIATATNLAGVHTQGRSLAQTRTRIREALKLVDMGDATIVEVKDLKRLGAGIDATLENLRKKRRLVEELQKETKVVAVRLENAGLSRRDVADLLDISHQRVHQLVS